MKRRGEEQERALGAQRMRLEQTQLAEGVVSILQKGVAEAKCVEACSAGRGPEKVAWDQTCSGSICTICSVELLCF